MNKTTSKSPTRKLVAGIILLVTAASAHGWAQSMATPAPTAAAATVIPVDSSAFMFSPGNWAGDQGRAGAAFRQTWNPGAYFRFYWSSATETPRATMLFDTAVFGDTLHTKPLLTYEVDGQWTANVPVSAEIPLAKLSGSGPHVLTVFLQASEEAHRWGEPGKSGTNVLRLRGVRLGAGSQPEIATRHPKWILEIGDSITEGIAANDGSADALSAYSYLVGQGLQQRDLEFSVSACGWSGWLKPGDNSGDVPGYYAVSGATDGRGGSYHDAMSRWNKIDANTSLLDADGRLSAYGGRGQQPSIITINYGTNDGLRPPNESDLRASIAQSLLALRRAAPSSMIFVIIPFSQYDQREITSAINVYRKGHEDKRLFTIDLGIPVAMALTGVAPSLQTLADRGKSAAGNEYWGGLHPNARGHAVLAARLLTILLARWRNSPQ